MGNYDNWLMTNPWDRMPNPYDYWEYVTDDEKFNYLMDEEQEEFLDHLDNWDFFPETLGKEDWESYTYEAWQNGDKELKHYLDEWFEYGDRQERLLRIAYPDMF